MSRINFVKGFIASQLQFSFENVEEQPVTDQSSNTFTTADWELTVVYFHSTKLVKCRHSVVPRDFKANQRALSTPPVRDMCSSVQKFRIAPTQYLSENWSRSFKPD